VNDAAAAPVRGARVVAPAEAPVIVIPSSTGIAAHVVLAGPGARTLAFVLDWLIRGALALAWLGISAWLILGNADFEVPGDRTTLWYLAGVVPTLIIYCLYHLILEPLMGGRTPGKRMIGLRVLTPDGVVPGIGALLTRNLFRIVDSMPVLYVVGLLFVMFGRQHLRLGDLAAGTVLAVDRAPFLEKFSSREDAARSGDWRAMRLRAAALGRRGGTEVRDALATVDDYRRVAHELGAARQQSGTPSELLEATYADLHALVHRPARRTWLWLWSLLRDRVPLAMHQIRIHLLAVVLLFVIAGVAGFWLVYSFPDLIALFASPALISTVERGELWTEGMLNVTPAAVMSVSILSNNIVVAWFAFCSGIVFGLGTFYLISLNGMSLGAIFALTAQHGLAGRLFDFVVAHGCVELSCICISGAAGALMGEALIRPGAHTRAEAFRQAVGTGVRVMAVVTALLLGCGFIEGYVSPNPEVPRWARVTIGVGYFLFMISLLRGYVFGRSRTSREVSTDNFQMRRRLRNRR
jgi:uncharacterized membrane protein SpoIIM required for sporulation/uncharacterized RDD family membrane protein YckC